MNNVFHLWCLRQSGPGRNLEVKSTTTRAPACTLTVKWAVGPSGSQAVSLLHLCSGDQHTDDDNDGDGDSGGDGNSDGSEDDGDGDGSDDSDDDDDKGDDGY